jgi:hypothetical protein
MQKLKIKTAVKALVTLVENNKPMVKTIRGTIVNDAGDHFCVKQIVDSKARYHVVKPSEIKAKLMLPSDEDLVPGKKILFIISSEIYPQGRMFSGKIVKLSKHSVLVEAGLPYDGFHEVPRENIQRVFENEIWSNAIKIINLN